MNITIDQYSGCSCPACGYFDPYCAVLSELFGCHLSHRGRIVWSRYHPLILHELLGWQRRQGPVQRIGMSNGEMGLYIRRRQGRRRGNMRELLGGKGAGLAEMATSACRCRRASPSRPRSAAISMPTARNYPPELKGR